MPTSPPPLNTPVDNIGLERLQADSPDTGKHKPLWERRYNDALANGWALTNLGTGDNAYWCFMPGELPVTRATVKALRARGLLEVTHFDLLGGALSYRILREAGNEAA